MGAPIPTRTPRLGLILDGDGAIEVQPSNWARVDQVSGIIYTKSTDTPLPNYLLYDGALVTEKDTGISWVAISDGSDGYTKRYTNYPFLYIANCGAVGIPNATDTEWGWDLYVSGVNSSVANRTPTWNGCRVPVKGLYSVQICVRWNGAGGQRRTQLRVNHATDDHYQEFLRDSGTFNASNMIKYNRVFNKDDEITMYLWQNSGASLGFYSVIYVEMIRPIQ